MDGLRTAAEGVIEREIRIDARPETVFSFWTDPAKMARWMGPRRATGPAARR